MIKSNDIAGREKYMEKYLKGLGINPYFVDLMILKWANSVTVWDNSMPLKTSKIKEYAIDLVNDWLDTHA